MTNYLSGAYGNPEISSTTFQCRLCVRQRPMKRTRNILTTHMKTVHGVSWQEYRNKTQHDSDQPILINEDNVELFQCALCEKKVKGKKQHLTRIHKIDLEVYEIYVSKLNSGEAVPKLENCKICSRLCLELEKHVRLCHRMEMDEYYIQEMETDQDPAVEQKEDPDSLRCSFNCGESFEKETELIIHINLVHANEDQEEKDRAKHKIMSDLEAKTISSKISCQICEGGYSSRSSLWVHVTRKHEITWKDYEAKYGSVDQTIKNLKPFRCLICGEEVHNEKQKILRHLKMDHSLSHLDYVNQYVKNNNGKRESVSKEEDRKIQRLRDSSVKSSPSPVSSSMNVTDRRVKRCSRCELDFPSRLRFIRHCQEVHRMKFRLRNGEKLPRL